MCVYVCMYVFIHLLTRKQGYQTFKNVKKASLDPLGELFSLLDWLDTVMTEWRMYV